MKGEEETLGGYYREPFQPLHNHYLVIVNANASDKGIETIRDKCRVKVSDVCNCGEVSQR